MTMEDSIGLERDDVMKGRNRRSSWAVFSQTLHLTRRHHRRDSSISSTDIPKLDSVDVRQRSNTVVEDGDSYKLEDPSSSPSTPHRKFSLASSASMSLAIEAVLSPRKLKRRNAEAKLREKEWNQKEQAKRKGKKGHKSGSKKREGGSQVAGKTRRKADTVRIRKAGSDLGPRLASSDHRTEQADEKGMLKVTRSDGAVRIYRDQIERDQEEVEREVEDEEEDEGKATMFEAIEGTYLKKDKSSSGSEIRSGSDSDADERRRDKGKEVEDDEDEDADVELQRKKEEERAEKQVLLVSKMHRMKELQDDMERLKRALELEHKNLKALLARAEKGKEKKEKEKVPKETENGKDQTKKTKKRKEPQDIDVQAQESTSRRCRSSELPATSSSCHERKLFSSLPTRDAPTSCPTATVH